MIVQQGNEILRKKADLVSNANPVKLNMLIKKLADTMFKEPDGIGIAAPQIGESLQIFLVAKDLFLLHSEMQEANRKERKKDYMIFINPILKKLSQKKDKDIEGCLSVRGVYGEVARSEKVNIEYFDEHGKKHERGASGLLARVIQHEMDHLNGILFIDKAKRIKSLNMKHET